MSITRLALSVVLATVLVACSQGSDSSVQQNPAAAADNTQYNLSLDITAFMANVVEPAAQELWQTAGWVLDRDQGYFELYPTNDEEWQDAYNHSAAMLEIGNLLLLPGRVQEGPWRTYAEAISTVGQSLMAATQAQNQEDYFQGGAQLYSVCTACHQAYNPEILTRF